MWNELFEKSFRAWNLVDIRINAESSLFANLETNIISRLCLVMMPRQIATDAHEWKREKDCIKSYLKFPQWIFGLSSRD